ncbi:glycosyltransferase family 1 protein [Modestobacter sp. Leaf380]|uniref:glycosyltransferase family 4 protein n=1 Tax=Modestobacter sp. Leaf380 TaxID=1736356 RepID=UPI001910D883|nr:glycosyltransferase family 1 protein [Modestobacter sp. Leaf380]
MPEPTTLRVAMTVEQCWQPVPGGSGTYIRELARAYRALEHLSVTGLAARHGGRPAPDGSPDLRVSESALPRQLLYRSWQQTRSPRAPRGHDVVHATTWAVPGHRVPLVVTVHDLAFRHDPGHFTPNGVAFFERGLQIARDEAAAVVVPSEVTREDCVAAGIDRDRVHVVLHGVRVATPSPAAVTAFRTRHGLARPYVLWVGTREPRKNLPRLLAAFDHVVDRGADLDLVLVGPDGWGGAADRVSAVTQDRVHVLGRLGVDELAASFAGARVFCYPSLREGFGMPVSEAMAHGVPVVTSRGTAMEEVAAGAAVLVDPLDAADVARGLLQADGPEHGRLARASAARAGHLDWARAARETVDVLRGAARA